MWFITLLVLALAAYLIIKAVSASAKRKELEQQQTPAISADQAASTTESSNTTSAPSNTPQVSTPTTSTASSPSGAESGLNTDDTLKDAQEMIKILNLAGSDAARLGISKDEFQAIRSGSSASVPSGDQLENVANKLRQMLA